MTKKAVAGILFILAILFSCRQEPAREYPDRNELKEKLIEHNKRKANVEDKVIDNFVAENFPGAKKSKTGLRYVIYPVGNNNSRMPANADRVIIDYDIESLNGTLLYSTRKEGAPEFFNIEYEDAPSGLHEGLQMMHLGDSAVFIMPSHLAYGFTGDQKIIGKNAILVYKVVLLEIE